MARPILYVVVLVLFSTSAFSQFDNLTAPLEARLKQLAEVISAGHDGQAEVQYLQSKVEQRFGHHNEALQLVEAAVIANPKKAAYHRQLASVLSDEINNARVFKKMSIAKRVHAQLDAAVKLEPGNPDCLFGTMLYYEQAPGILGGSRDKAHRLAEQIGRINRSRGYLAEAQLALMEKKTGELEDLYVKAVEADPTSFDALAALTGFYGAQTNDKKYELAIRYLSLLSLGHN